MEHQAWAPLKRAPLLCCRLRKKVPRGHALPRFKTEKQLILEASDLSVSGSSQSRTAVLAEQAAGQELAGLAQSRHEEKHAPKHEDEGEEAPEEDGKPGCALNVVSVLLRGRSLQCVGEGQSALADEQADKKQPCWPCKSTADAQAHRHLQEADSVRSLGPQVRCLALQRAACVEAASSLQGIADLQELSCLR